jgi:hypothetical protein
MNFTVSALFIGIFLVLLRSTATRTLSLGVGFTAASEQSARISYKARSTELPLEQSTRFKFAFNLKMAKALGLSVPPTLLARADEVIESASADCG